MRNQQIGRRTAKRYKTVLIYCLVAVLAAILCLAANSLNLQALLKIALNWINNLGSIKPIAFIIIYNLATLLFIPGAILSLGGGIIFGVIWGTVYVFLAATLGATAAFLIGRYLTRDWLGRQMEKHPKFQAIDEAIAREGFKIVLLTRLSPLIPFNLLNYVLSVTTVSLKHYLLGSIGMIPGAIVYVYLGSLTGDIAGLTTAAHLISPQAKAINLAVHIIGCIATVVLTVYLTLIAKKALNETVS